MNEFELGFELQLAALAIVLLLIIILIFFMVRKRISKKEDPEKDHKISEPAKQAEEIKVAAEPLCDTEPEKESFVETQTNETVITPTLENLPQDSMLRRHTLANLRAMIESLKPPRPTDSNLCRHYDTMLIAEIGQCLSNDAAMQRLICNYEDHKKTLAQQIQEPKAIAEPLIKAGISHEDSVAPPEKPKLPEDSMLRRHTITQLYALVESNRSLRPTDSVLRRHYDTMIDNEVKEFL